MGKEFNIQTSWLQNAPNKIVQKPVHGTTIEPGVDHPIASVDDLGAYEVAQNFYVMKKIYSFEINAVAYYIHQIKAIALLMVPLAYFFRARLAPYIIPMLLSFQRPYGLRTPMTTSFY